jgi:hypothetical protein
MVLIYTDADRLAFLVVFFLVAIAFNPLVLGLDYYALPPNGVLASHL